MGGLIASGSLDMTARLWALDSAGACGSHTVLGGHEGRITSLQFAAAGAQLVTGPY